MKTILLFRTTFHPQMRQDYEPLYAFARRHGWQVQTIDYLNAAVTRHWTGSKAPEPNVAEILDFWRPDGCVVECGGIPHEPWEALFRNVPTVFLDRPPPEDGSGAVCVSSDSKEIAAFAARELLSQNLETYVYVAFHATLPWNENRGRWFAHYVHQHGKTFLDYRMLPPNAGHGRIDALSDFLSGLPTPCGLFSANDENARDIVTCCTRMGLRIPEDIALVSVDNDVEICDHLPVSVTSIELDTAASIVRAVELLAQLLEKPRKTVRNRTFGVRRIVRRASSNGLPVADRRLAAAVEFIRVNACNEIRPADVAKVMGCSMRLANMKFRDIRHNTILDEIHLRRLDLAKEQLQGKENPIERIAGLCGYASVSDFGRVFKRYTGMTPRAWRNG